MKIEKSIRYYSSGNIWHEWWYYNMHYWHREDGPADIYYYESGKVSYEAWWVNDKRHRIDGPAWAEYDEDGTISNEYYYINDIRLTKEKWEDHPLRQEYLIKEAMKEALECKE